MKPTVDYQSIQEVRDLPVSWRSTHGRSLNQAAAYERDCRRKGLSPDRRFIDNLIAAPRVHLRETILANGLRYVTIHDDDDNGRMVFDDHEYYGLISCNCGAIHDKPAVGSAKAINNADLGDGFKLAMTISGESPEVSRSSTVSYVEKEFSTATGKVKVHYNLNPFDPHEAGRLRFEYEHFTDGELSYRLKELSAGQAKVRREKKEYLARQVTVRISGDSTKVNKSILEEGNHPYCTSSVEVAYNLASNLWHCYNGAWDQVRFEFGMDGALEKVIGISKTMNPCPVIQDPFTSIAMRKGKNEWFEYDARAIQSKLLARAFLGKDVTSLQHNAAETLDALVDAATKGQDVDPLQLLQFAEK